MFIFILIPFFSCVFSQTFIKELNVIQVGKYTNFIFVLNKTHNFEIFENNTQCDYEDLEYFIINNNIILQVENIVMKNFEKNIYTCIYDDGKNKFSFTFKNFTSINLINPFSLNNMKIKYIDNININFKKIFPIPECFVKINNEYIFPENNIQNKTLDYLYSQVNLNMEIENISCNTKVKIICTLINQTFTSETKKTCIYNNSSNLIIIICIILFLIFVIFLLITKIIIGIIIFIYFKRKNPIERKEILYSLINIIKNNKFNINNIKK